MAYLLTEPLNDAWTALSVRSTQIDVPVALVRSPQNPLAALWAALDAWTDRYTQAVGVKSVGLTVRELEQWTAKLQEQQALVSRLESQYPRKTNGGSGKIIQAQEHDVAGALPWWYWPLRIGAGVGVGWLTYRALRPKGAAAFAGLGISWPEWLEEARRDDTDPRARRVLKEAWKRGEDPRSYWLDDEPGPRSGQRRD